ncbi:MAG TPA: rRNA maturation RNase YbeY [Xanthobacteraceae bacterium]|nr:rRNA maturation RNase YbeY [Xanthobacteraceae bacterium]
MTRRARQALKIDVLVESDRWQNVKTAGAIVRRAVMRAAAALSTSPTELAVVLTDDPAIRALNRNWRGIDTATNVLSFATKNAAGRHLGDIVLAYETIAREAGRDRKPFAHHLAHLAVHGFLHLVGYDHHHDDNALAMEDAERAILWELRIPDPYRTRGRNNVRHRARQPAKHDGRGGARIASRA